MKVILTGATGYVREGVLLAMLDDPRIEKVLSVGRRSCGVTHPKLEEYILPDLMELKAGDERLAGYDLIFFIAGITSVGTPKDIYKVISHDIPVHFAEIMPDKEKCLSSISVAWALQTRAGSTSKRSRAVRNRVSSGWDSGIHTAGVHASCAPTTGRNPDSSRPPEGRKSLLSPHPSSGDGLYHA